MVSQEEINAVLTDLTWLDRCTCSQLPLNAYFVAAGQTITPETTAVARSCPARRQEIIFAYGRNIKAGYTGGLSAGQRAAMTLDEALEHVANEVPLPVS